MFLNILFIEKWVALYWQGNENYLENEATMNEVDKNNIIIVRNLGKSIQVEVFQEFFRILYLILNIIIPVKKK